MIKKGYLVCELGYEYNDEIYHRPEYEGITPHKVYLDKEVAEKAAEKENLEQFRRIRIRSFCYGQNDICSDEDKCNNLLESIGTCWDKFEDGAVDLEGMSEVDLLKVMEAFDKLRFFEVREVDVV